ncbi:hypothetical protein B7Z17_00700, partial [Candidatus Saccharibacteria bacterium 32-49-10]
VPLELAGDDPNAINTRLLNQKLIDNITGEPVGAYADFVKNCIDREIPIGSSGEDSTADMGESCFIPDKTTGLTVQEQTTVDMYVHYIDQRVNDTMENGYTSSTTGQAAPDLAAVGVGLGNGEMKWPVDKKFWDQNESQFLRGHNGAGSFTGNENSVDLSLPKGTPVYAMLSGKVVKRPLGRSSYMCTGDPNVGNNGGLMIESEYQGKKVLIAYAHGDNVTTKSTVVAGEQIMTLGEVGNSCGPHLHMDFSYDGAGVCLQDIFPLLAADEAPNLGLLVTEATPDCRGRG